MIDLDAIRRKADMDNIQGYISLDALQTIRGLIDEVERLRKHIEELANAGDCAVEMIMYCGKPVMNRRAIRQLLGMEPADTTSFPPGLTTHDDLILRPIGGCDHAAYVLYARIGDRKWVRVEKYDVEVHRG